MTELISQPALLQEQPAYLHQTGREVSVDALRAHFSDSPDLYPDNFKPVAEEFLSRREQEQLTSEQVREDSLNHLMTPEAGRKGSEVQDPFTSEIRKPCFELEIDEDSKVEVGSMLGKRSEGLAVVHSLLDKLPPMKHSYIEAGPLPLVDSLQPYVDKAELVYKEWQIEKQNHALKEVEVRKTHDYANDPFGGPRLPRRQPKPDTEFQTVQYMWRLPKNENADYSAQPAEELVEGIVKEYEDFGRWRTEIVTKLEANRTLVAEGLWPGEKVMAEIEDEANRRDPHTQGTKAELVRSLLANRMVSDLGLRNEHDEKQLAGSQYEGGRTLSHKVKSGLLSSLGLIPSKYESEGTQRAGTLADVYLSTEDAQAYDALADRLDDMFARAGETAPSESLQLRSGHLADRVTDFAQQLIPAGASLIHTTHANRLEDILQSGALKSRTASGSKESVMGDHSNYVHFAEPGKVNYYGATLLAVPIEEVIAKTPYHQAEAQYKKGGRPINTQEKFGAITVHPAQLPLAASMRLAELNDRFAGGLLDETTQGGTNNMSFAASKDRKFAGEYGYAVDKLQVICNPDNAVRVQDFVPAERLVVANEQGMDFGHSVGTAGFRFEKPVDLSQDSVIVYGPLSQRRVDFSEDHLRVEASQKTFVSQEQQRKNDAAEEHLKAWAEKVRAEADAAGMSVEAYEAWRDEEYRKKLEETFAGGKPIEIPSFGVSF